LEEEKWRQSPNNFHSQEMKKKASDFPLKSHPKETKIKQQKKSVKKREEKATHEPRQINLKKQN